MPCRMRGGRSGHEIIAPGHSDLDVNDLGGIKRALDHYTPQLVIHAAAYTNVDGCETNPDLAFKVNALGTRNVAVVTAAIGIPLMYISTDFVFNGNRPEEMGPYTEFDPVGPLSVYGRSKQAGEEFVREMNPRHFIARGAWLFGHQGKNFVKTILDLARSRKKLTVVNDQVGSPTYVADMADQLLALASTEYYGLYHLTNDGECSWFAFAREILAGAAKYEPGLADVEVVPISTGDLGRPAPRPAYSALRNYNLELTFGTRMRLWKDALHDYLQRMYQKGEDY